MLWKCELNLKILILYVYFFNMHISLIMALICLKTCICIAEIGMEGTVYQNVDIGLSLCVIACRRRNFGKKITKVTRFLP